MDIVEQLRKSANTVYSQDGYTFRLGLHNEAADEIERLRSDEKKYQAIIIKLIAKKVADKYWSKFLTGDDFNPWDALEEDE
jgi:hypothetical protein